MIQYKKAGITDNFLRLVKKFKSDQKFIKSLLTDIENKFCSILEVYYDGKLYGVLVVRGEYDRSERLGVFVLHAIAEDNLNIHFGSILRESLEEYLLSLKSDTGDQVFFWIRQAADNKVIARMLESYYGQPYLKTYQKDLETNENRLNREKTPSLNNRF